MSLQLGIHAVALLNICDYCTRSNNEKPQFIGALFGQVQEREIIVNHTFELKLEGKSVDMQLLHDRAELFEAVNPGQRLIGWFAVGTSSIEPWMYDVHTQIAQAVSSPILGIFDIPFNAQLGILPFKFYNTDFEELQVQMRVDETEQIALQDVLSAQGRRNSVKAQLIKETRAILLLHQHLAQLRGFLVTSCGGRQKAEVVSTILQLCRDHDFGASQQIQKVENEVLAMLTSGLIARGDAIISGLF